MLLFVISLVIAYETTDLVPCLDLVKWKIDHYEENFDKILALSKLNPEKHLDKIIAGMIEYCGSKMTQEIKEKISNKADLISFDHLVPFPSKPYILEEELELTSEQDKILDQLKEYTDSLSKIDYQLIFLATSFAIVVIVVVLKNLSFLIKHQKIFKMD